MWRGGSGKCGSAVSAKQGCWVAAGLNRRFVKTCLRECRRLANWPTGGLRGLGPALGQQRQQTVQPHSDHETPRYALKGFLPNPGVCQVAPHRLLLAPRETDLFGPARHRIADPGIEPTLALQPRQMQRP